MSSGLKEEEFWWSRGRQLERGRTLGRREKGRRWVIKWTDRKTVGGGVSSQTLDNRGQANDGLCCVTSCVFLLCQGKASSLHSQHAVLPVSRSILQCEGGRCQSRLAAHTADTHTHAHTPKDILSLSLPLHLFICTSVC